MKVQREHDRVVVDMSVREAQDVVDELDGLVDDASHRAGHMRHVREVFDENPTVKQLFHELHQAADHHEETNVPASWDPPGQAGGF